MKEIKPRRKALTFEQAQSIRAEYATGKSLQKDIAERYGVLSKTISQICNNEILLGEPRKKPVPTAEAEVTYRGMACYSKVLTGQGWKRADEVTMSDKLVAVDGTYTNIVSIHVDIGTPLYQVVFDDNIFLNTAADHRWWTLDQKTGWKDGWRLKTSSRIASLPNDHHIPTCEPVPGNKHTGKDPYVIGLILGDGSSVPNISSTTIYNEDEYILNYMVDNFGWSRYEYEDCVPRVSCTKRKDSEEWKDVVGRSKGHFKFVPPDLLMADPETRLAVLQGLLDTDGCADKDGRISFASVSDKLSADVRYLTRSLGGKSNSGYSDREPTGFGGGPYYKTGVTASGKFMPFRLPRKIERCVVVKGINRRIVSVTPVETSPSVSFTIDHESHQFVVQDFIVVHDATGVPICRKLPSKKTPTT